MESILSLLRRMWVSDELEADSFVASLEEQDRSSMAEFVRILQTQDQAETSEQQ